MQTLSLEIATTFLDDAAALAGGAIRIIIQILNQPVERLANVCDVAGVLPPAVRSGRRFARPFGGTGHNAPGAAACSRCAACAT